MVGQRLRRLPNIKPTSDQRLITGASLLLGGGFRAAYPLKR